MLAPTFLIPPGIENLAIGTRIWFFDASATVVNQSVVPVMSKVLFQFLWERVEREVKRRWLPAGRKVRYVHEWSSIDTYEMDARHALIAWGKETKPHSSGTLIKLSDEASPFLRIAAMTGANFVSLAGGKVSVVKDLRAVYAELRQSFAPRWNPGPEQGLCPGTSGRPLEASPPAPAPRRATL